MARCSLYLLVTTCLVAAWMTTNAQLVKQCTCPEVIPCKQAYIQALPTCGSHCKKNAEALGASYDSLKPCFLKLGTKIKATVECFEKKHANICGPAGEMVPTRHPETLKIAVIAEAERILERSGLSSDVKEFLSIGKKIFKCMHNCMDKEANDCQKKLACGLNLPSDNVIVADVKQCALESGIDNAAIQQVCECAVNAGVKRLTAVCPKITIF